MGGEINEEYGVGSPKEISQDQPHPGVAPPDEEVVHHKYYQWVVFVLFLQAACFHLPRLIWKHSEGGLMKMLVGNLTDPMMTINKGDRSDRIQFIKKYFKESMKSHGPYAMKFFFCEFLCLVNVIGQMYFTDRFLGYTFMTYGSDVFAMTFGDPEGRSDPMNMVFPKVTKCTFHKYGPSGTVTRHDDSASLLSTSSTRRSTCSSGFGLWASPSCLVLPSSTEWSSFSFLLSGFLSFARVLSTRSRDRR